MRPAARRVTIALAAAVTAVLLAACTPAAPEESSMPTLVPQPASLQERAGGPFELVAASRIIVGGDGARAVGEYLAEAFRTATGFPLEVVDGADAGAQDVAIVVDSSTGSGAEGSGTANEAYSLTTGADGVRLEAATAEGAFRGIQTVRQLFDPAIESREPVEKAWTAPPVTIADHPRFAYRGAMLDTVRHFFPVADVKRYIDEIALLKVNYLHLHLTDDQGWRIQIDSWPNLTAFGSTSEVGGIGEGTGGFYTKADYAEIVDYAASRFITIVPEIDLPGHTNAALASYPELNCDGVAPDRYTGIEVGFSTLCIDKELTYDFVADVVRELAELTPGPYLHLGGDESLSTPTDDFVRFIERVTAEAAAATGKTIIGWHEMGKAKNLPSGTVGQYWGFVTPQEGFTEETLSFIVNDGKVIMSPADVAYLDMVYEADGHSRLGQAWANGATPVSESSAWDPSRIVPGVGEDQLLGVEAPIWTETLASLADVEIMAFPRMANVAEIGWSPKPEGARDWQEVAPRLVAFCERLDALGVSCYRSPELPWAP